MKLSAIKIRGILYQKGMTQNQLAEVSGITRATINAVCNGKSCSYISALRIAAALEVELEDISRSIDDITR